MADQITARENSYLLKCTLSARLNKMYYMRNATLEHVQKFQDGSSFGLAYFDNGYISMFREMAGIDDTAKVPEAELYYWQVMRDMPEISTWEQIKEAEREDNAVLGK